MQKSRCSRVDKIPSGDRRRKPARPFDKPLDMLGALSLSKRLILLASRASEVEERANFTSGSLASELPTI